LPLSRADLFERIQSLPVDERDLALELALEVYGAVPDEPADQGGRDADQRRAYNGDPSKYFHEILGWSLTPQQENVLELIEQEDRVLCASANNMGKTFLLAGYGVYRFDVVGALPDPTRGAEQQGGRILLPGPDRSTIFATIFASMLDHATAAERRGFPMPGYRSDKSVLWRVRQGWEVEAFAPPKRKDRTIAHTVSGRHHVNQVALIEEGAGVEEPVWAGAEGMCSGAGNKIISLFNPDVPAGPAYVRAERGAWSVIHLSAFDHPNVQRRSIVVPGAVDFKVVDGKVRSQCMDRGPFPITKPEAGHRDFVYALAQRSAPETGPRSDGHLGHPAGELRVYRPGPLFETQVLGQWPSSVDNRLFSRAALDAGMARWRARPMPETPPDRVGVDPAREGSDNACAAPAWGMSAEQLLRAWAEAQESDEAEALSEELREGSRMYVGVIVSLPKGDGPTLANNVAAHFPEAGVFNVDEGGVGASAYDHMARVIGLPAVAVSFGASPPDPTPGEQWSENMRTALYVRAAMLSNLGLIDTPDSPALREELMAHELVHRYRVVEEQDQKTRLMRKVRKPSVLLIDKDTVKERIGRSPDLADAYVLAVNEPAPRKRRMVFVS
jgi:hypothetical protein